MAFTYQFIKENDLAILNLEGKLVDKAEAVEISVEIEEELAEGTSRYIIDLSELEYMNSTGLNILINLMNKARNAGGEAVIVGVKPRIMALLAVTKLNNVFTIKSTRSEAFSFFKQLSL